MPAPSLGRTVKGSPLPPPRGGQAGWGPSQWHGGPSGRNHRASTKRRYSKEESARRGDAIYEKEVRPHLKADDAGKFAAIDIESGEFAIDADELRAGSKLRKRIPEAQI